MVNKIEDIKPLVIGIGVAGKRHLEAQLNLGIQTGIYTTNSQTAKSLKNYEHVIVFDHLEGGLEWANLVHICTPDDKHTEFMAMALKKGKVVICEKPFTTNFQDALYLKSLADKYHTQFFVGQNYRLTPTFTETKKMLMEGQLGALSRIETTYFHDRGNFQGRYPDDSFLYTGGSHAIDLASWVTGEQITEVKTFSKNPLNFDIEVKFSSGLQGGIKLDASSSRAVSGTDLIVYGEAGRIVSNNKFDELSFYKHTDQKKESVFLPNTKTFTIPLEIQIIDDYFLGRNTSHWPIPTADEALNLIKVLEVIKSSNSSGKYEKV